MSDTLALPGGWLDLPSRGRAWVWDSGPPATASRPPVVLLHGWTSTAALNWCRCFQPLAAEGRVVAMDHRGHGRGIRAGRPFTLEDCADDVAALVEQLDLGPAVIAGYSMGGPIAQLVWRRHRSAVAGLVLCATAASLHEGPVPAVVMQGLGLACSLALSVVPARVLRQVMRVLGPAIDEEALAPWAVGELQTGDLVAFVQAGAAMSGFDSTGWLGEVDVPTAIIVTSADRTVSPARQWDLARSIPAAATFAIDADHRACLEQPDLFVPALLAACQTAGAASRVLRPWPATPTSSARTGNADPASSLLPDTRTQ